MSDLPKGWTEVALGDVAEQVRGVSYKKDQAATSPGPSRIPILRAGNLRDGGQVDDSDLVWVPDICVSERQRLRPGDVIVATSSGSLDVVGKAARYKGTRDLSFGAFCKVMRPASGVDASYFAHYFQTSAYRRTVSALAAGANINNLKNSHLDELRFPLPPLEEQRRIAAILDKADELRAKRRSALEQLDSLIQAIFLDMFGDPLTNPLGWERVRLGSLLESIDSGKSPVCAKEPALSGEWGVLKLGAVTFGRFDPSENKRLPSENHADPRHEVRAGDVLFSRKNTAQLVGACVYVPDTPPRRLLSDLIFRLRIAGNNRLTARYLVGALHSPRMKRSVQALATGAAASMPNISKQKLMSVEVPVPDHLLQVRFEGRCDAVELTRRNLERGVDEAESLATSLQSRAFRGEL